MSSWNIWNWIVGGVGSNVSIRMEKLKNAEQRLLEYAYRHVVAAQPQQPPNGDDGSPNIKIRTIDTMILKSSIPLHNHDKDYVYGYNNNKNNNSNNALWKNNSSFCDSSTTEHFNIHSVHVTSPSSNHIDDKNNQMKKSDIPLVMLHGYMNGGAYFYRNFIGLSQYFTSIYALDMLGWGLSSRPDFSSCNLKTKNSSNIIMNDENIKKSWPSSLLSSLWSKTTLSDTTTENDSLIDKSYKIQAAEDFFVESLEEWRKINNIDKMILAGHSMGGYLSVAYVERYPQHVEQLILISPVGVPQITEEELQQRKERIKQSSLPFRMMINFWRSLFGSFTLGDILRILPESSVQRYSQNYVQRRLPLITLIGEQKALTDYLLYNNILPGSGEYCVDKILDDTVNARVPLVNRIPKLQISKVGFLYGEHDWMDIKGAIQVQNICNDQQQNQMKNKQMNGTEHQNSSSTTTKTSSLPSPEINIYQISQSGHLLMLENWQEFNNGLLLCCNEQNEFIYNTMNNNNHLPKKIMLNQKNSDIDKQQSNQTNNNYKKQSSSTQMNNDNKNSQPNVVGIQPTPST